MDGAAGRREWPWCHSRHGDRLTDLKRRVAIWLLTYSVRRQRDWPSSATRCARRAPDQTAVAALPRRIARPPRCSVSGTPYWLLVDGGPSQAIAGGVAPSPRADFGTVAGCMFPRPPARERAPAPGGACRSGDRGDEGDAAGDHVAHRGPTASTSGPVSAIPMPSTAEVAPIMHGEHAAAHLVRRAALDEQRVADDRRRVADTAEHEAPDRDPDVRRDGPRRCRRSPSVRSQPRRPTSCPAAPAMRGEQRADHRSDPARRPHQAVAEGPRIERLRCARKTSATFAIAIVTVAMLQDTSTVISGREPQDRAEALGDVGPVARGSAPSPPGAARAEIRTTSTAETTKLPAFSQYARSGPRRRR